MYTPLCLFQVPLLQSLSLQHRVAIADSLTTRTYNDGEVIMHVRTQYLENLPYRHYSRLLLICPILYVSTVEQGWVVLPS